MRRPASPVAERALVIPVSHNISAMTDISANIFALLILILIIMLAARENSPAPGAEGLQIIDLEKDVAALKGRHSAARS